jgi:gamma-glutamylcyclotransferase (GGCT)/AIG2-like uncharacterized protein YtfP
MLIFVYGTLRFGETNHAQLNGARLVAKVYTAPSYELVDMGDYPALIEVGEMRVYGELYEVADALVRQLDEFEEVPTLYERREVQIAGYIAQAYVMRRESADRAPRIASGDWCHRSH